MNNDVLVSGGLPWGLMSGVLTGGGDITHSCDEVVLRAACCYDVCWLYCCVGCCCELWTVC